MKEYSQFEKGMDQNLENHGNKIKNSISTAQKRIRE